MAEGTHDTPARRRALIDALRAVEREGLRVRAALAALGPGEPIPGLHLVVRVAGTRALLPGARVAEIARLVACDPVPAAPPWLLGSFVWRGRPALAVDLGVRLGAAPSASLEAVMIILDGAPSVALVVEEVQGLAEDPLLADGAGGGGAHLAAAACTVDGEALPLLAPELLEREVRGDA